MHWAQVYDPLGHPAFSTLLAALPVVVLLGALGLFRARAHVAALLSLGVALVVALGPFGMPVSAGLAREVLEGTPSATARRTTGLRTSGIVVSSAGGVRSREKMVWDWPSAADRVIEELR